MGSGGPSSTVRISKIPRVRLAQGPDIGYIPAAIRLGFAAVVAVRREPVPNLHSFAYLGSRRRPSAPCPGDEECARVGEDATAVSSVGGSGCPDPNQLTHVVVALRHGPGASVAEELHDYYHDAPRRI